MSVVYGIYYNDKLLYIGSTSDLRKRKNHHHSRCYNVNSDKYHYQIYKYIRDNDIDFREDCDFKILEHVEDEEDLHQREDHYIKTLTPTCNSRSAYTDKVLYNKQYRKEHSNERKQKAKQYRKEHVEEARKYKKQYRQKHADKKYICECGGRYTTNHISEHAKSQKHIYYIENCNVNIYNQSNPEEINLKV